MGWMTNNWGNGSNTEVTPQTCCYQMKHLIISGLGNFLNHLFYA